MSDRITARDILLNRHKAQLTLIPTGRSNNSLRSSIMRENADALIQQTSMHFAMWVEMEDRHNSEVSACRINILK